MKKKIKSPLIGIGKKMVEMPYESAFNFQIYVYNITTEDIEIPRAEMHTNRTNNVQLHNTMLSHVVAMPSSFFRFASATIYIIYTMLYAY